MLTAFVTGALVAVATQLAGPAAPLAAPAPYLVAANPKGLDLSNDKEIKTSKSSRTGHAPFTAAQLKGEVAKLPAPQRAAYQTVHTKIAKFPESAQLDALVVKHRVSAKDMRGKPIIVNLAFIVTHPCKFGIANVQLARDTISDITRPSTIYQAGHGTCTATSVSAALARRTPGEYVRIVSDLAITGSARVRNGPSVLTIKDFIPFKDRATTGNLLQPAIMELEATVEKGHYVNKEDKIHLPNGTSHSGASDKGVSLAETQILGGRYETMYTGRAEFKRDPKKKAMYTTYLGKCLAVLSRASATNPVLIDAKLASEGGHEMQCVGYAGGIVTIRNPWGQVHKIPVAKIKASLEGVNYRVGD